MWAIKGRVTPAGPTRGVVLAALLLLPVFLQAPALSAQTGFLEGRITGDGGWGPDPLHCPGRPGGFLDGTGDILSPTFGITNGRDVNDLSEFRMTG